MNTAATLTRPVTLRPVRAADAAAMQRFVMGLDAAARRFRFHGAVNGCGPALLNRLTTADGAGHVAFVACTLADDGAEVVVGEARYFVDAEQADSAEFAIAVADSVRGSGVAAELMAALVRAAGRAGLHWLHGDVIDGNERMAAFMRRQGFEIDVWAEADAGIVRWQRNVPRPARAARAARSTKRAAKPATRPQWPGVKALQGWLARLAPSVGNAM